MNGSSARRPLGYMTLSVYHYMFNFVNQTRSPFMINPFFDFGMIGLGTMGRNLLLNIADHGFAATGFDKDSSKGQLLERSATQHTRVKSAASLSEMVDSLIKPRKVMMLVPAGPIVDAVIKDLLPLLEEGDIIIDGGNSHYTDTLKRIDYLRDKKIHFIGMGVSGGEHGARTGPSIMPGGDPEAWKALKPILEAVSAKVNDEPCVAYMGKQAAGHYVKMVHNGIEYSLMQLISEVYDFLKRALGMNNDELSELFSQWNAGEMRSFLLEITAQIFLQKDDSSNERLVDMILDRAGSKGTGKWTSQDSMDLPVAVPGINAAVALRDLSDYKEERLKAAALFQPKIRSLAEKKDRIVPQLHDALYCATIISYAQGLEMLQVASKNLQMDIPLADVVKIWRGGCIIRSESLNLFYKAFKKDNRLFNLLLNKKIASLVKKKQKALRKMVQLFASAQVPASGLMSALGYFDAYSSATMPTNLIQAQRDFFGAHTYQRIDKEGSFHTEWGG